MKQIYITIGFIALFIGINFLFSYMASEDSNFELSSMTSIFIAALAYFIYEGIKDTINTNQKEDQVTKWLVK